MNPVPSIEVQIETEEMLFTLLADRMMAFSIGSIKLQYLHSSKICWQLETASKKHVTSDRERKSLKQVKADIC